MTLDALLARLAGVKRRGSRVTARCPAHDDKRPSLSVGVGDDGRLLLKCHAGCATDAVVAALRLTMADLFPARMPRPGGNRRVPRTGGRRGSAPAGRASRTTRYEIRDPDGTLVAIHVREDRDDGKHLWWEQPTGKRGLGGRKLERLPLYGIHDLVGDPTRPVVVCEGEKAADALRTRSLAALGTVTGASGTPDDDVLRPLSGRRVVLWPDNDKPGRAHMARIGEALRRLGCADVRQVEWREAPAKGDAYDFFENGATVAAARELVDAAPAWTPPATHGGAHTVGASDETSPYVVEGGRMCWRKPTRDGAVNTPLCLFTATIGAQVTRDDGSGEPDVVFEVAGALASGRALPTIAVPAGEFAAMAWPVAKWGAEAVVHAGLGVRDHLRAAIQMLSGLVPRRTVYAHTGWRRIDERWVYLHTSGGIGASGAIEGVTVELTGALTRYALPVPPTGPDRIAALRASLALWNLAPTRVMAPLLGMVGLAPLCDPLGTDQPDFVLWLHGASGVGKSELAALAQAHFGTFARATLPASFTATANAIERFAFTTKDALLVVDDFHPPHDQREAQAMAQVATRLVRGVGNASGRSRMQRDLRLRPDLPPRGVIVVTGERLLEGQSNTARVFAVPVEKGMVELSRLGRAQTDRGALASTTAAYVQWLAARMDGLRETLPARYRTLRVEAQRAAGPGHAREPGQIAHLMLGLETFLAFAVEVGAVADVERAAQLEDAWTACLANADEHARDVVEEDPVVRFRRLLADGFASRKIFVETRDGKAPDEAGRWGWELITRTDEMGAEYDTWQRPRGTATRVGVLDEDWLLLFPEATYQYLAMAARTGGPPFPVEPNTLLKRLHEAGLIATTTEGGRVRRTVNVRLTADGTSRVLKLRVQALEEPAMVPVRSFRDAHDRPAAGDQPGSVGRRLAAVGERDETPEPGSFDGPEPPVPAASGNRRLILTGSGNGKAERHRRVSEPVLDVPAVPAPRDRRDTPRTDVGSV